MKVQFRQGIARYQTDISGNPSFLQRNVNTGAIDLVVSPDPTIIIFAHRNANYVFEEVKTIRNAWGPFGGSVTQYLYWDVDLLTGALTRGATTLPPIVTSVAPLAPSVDQHWFDNQEMVMKVWIGARWVEKIRVFAATLSSSGNIRPAPGISSSSTTWLGSQIGVNGDFEAGNIVLDSFFNPIRQSDGSFVTSTTNMSVVSIGTRRVRFETDLISLMAEEYIAKFFLVQLRQGRRAMLARSTDRYSRVVGITLEDMYFGETATIVTGGLVRNEQWSWPSSAINRPLFCGATGQVTLTPPTTGVHQQIGYVYDTDAIFMDIQQPIILDIPSDVGAPPPPPPPTFPTAEFTAAIGERSGPAPLIVNFLNASVNATSYEWDFGNDGVVDSSAPNPTFTFNYPGSYAVRLRAINAFGSDEEVKTGFITVTAAPPVGTFTNLEVTLGGPMRVNRAQAFTVMMTVRNDGLANASSVVRTIVLPDVQGPGDTLHEVVPSGLPMGSTVARVGTTTVATLPPIVMASAASSAITFTVLAPSVNSQVTINASAASPETDAELSDNTTSLYVEVRS